VTLLLVPRQRAISRTRVNPVLDDGARGWRGRKVEAYPREKGARCVAFMNQKLLGHSTGKRGPVESSINFKNQMTYLISSR